MVKPSPCGRWVTSGGYCRPSSRRLALRRDSPDGLVRDCGWNSLENRLLIGTSRITYSLTVAMSLLSCGWSTQAALTLWQESRTFFAADGARRARTGHDTRCGITRNGLLQSHHAQQAPAL